MMRAKIIGVMKMRDDKGEDDKLIAVHADDPNYADYGDVSEIPGHRLRELQRFFEDYKVLEHKKVLVGAPQGRSVALEVLRDAIRLYDRERDRLRSGALAAEEASASRPPAARKAARRRR
jgi:inorganic pyrophosphatase